MATGYKYTIYDDVYMPPRVGGVSFPLDTVRGMVCHFSPEKKKKYIPLPLWVQDMVAVVAVG
jgi:hypothetical protein